MKQIFTIYLKQLRLHFFLMLLLVLGQLAAGRMNQLFLGSQTPPTALEVFVEAPSPAAADFVDSLAALPDVSIKESDNFNSAHLKTAAIQGILVVPADFQTKLLTDDQDLVTLYLAAGIQDSAALNDLLVGSILQLKSQYLLTEELTAADLPPAKTAHQGQNDLQLQVVYLNNDTSQAAGKSANQSLPMGIMAVFLLISLLYGCSFIPSQADRRLRLYSFKNLLRCQILAFAALLLLWFFELFLLTIGVTLLLGAACSLEEIGLLAAVLLYCLSFSLLLNSLGLQKHSGFLFVPWLLLNLTVGGALWNIPADSPWLRPFLPAAMVIDQQLPALLSCTVAFLTAASLIGLLRAKKEVN